MTALTRFLDRHGLDTDFAAKAGVAASMAVVAAVTFFAPIKAHAQSFDAKHNTTIGRNGMSERMETLAIRTNDRLGDMVQMSKAVHNLFESNQVYDAQIAASIDIEINNRLYQDTPYPALAEMDFQKMNPPENLEEGAAMEYAIDAINAQKDVLTKSTQALEGIVAAFNRNDAASAQDYLYALDSTLGQYQAIEPRILESIQVGIRDMKRTNGWQLGIASYED